MAGQEDILLIEKLSDGETYQLWKFQTTIFFKAQGLHEIVMGIKKFETLQNDDEKADWSRKDARAQKIIITTIDKKMMAHIINCKTAKEMLDKLSTLFDRDSEQQKCNLLQDFFNYKYEKGMDMTSTIAKLENMAYKLKALNQGIDDQMIISKILAILPEKYKHFTTAWESTSKTEKTLTNLTARLIAEEARHKENLDDYNQVAFKSDIKCFKCNEPNHIARYCKNKNRDTSKIGHNQKIGFHKQAKFQNERNICTICKKNNHAEKDCYFKKKHETANQKVSFLTMNCEEKHKRNIDFVVDSGCTSHMSNNKTLFENIQEKKCEILVAKDKESMEAQGIGIISGDACTLKKVLYVPELSKNLLSVNAITENEGTVLFTKDKVLITKDEKIIEGRKLENGLYSVDILNDKNENTENSLITENKIEALEWHKKLGHIGIQNMKKLIGLVDGMKITEKDCLKLQSMNCDICLKSKQTRLPFKTERTRADRPLQIIHVDLCGPIDPLTWNGKKYILTVLDDYSHFTMVYLLENKSEAVETLKDCIHEIEAQKNICVSKIRCDNGGEFANEKMKSWCKKKGIILDFTVSYTPQLNGKAERLNRTLLEKTRAILFESKIDKEMWGEAVQTSAYLLNRSPSEAVNVTPAEKWFGKRPNISNIHKFGCDAHAKVLGYLKKLEPRSKRYKLVGYAPNGYRLWDNEARTIIIARDVIFENECQEIIHEENIRIIIDEEKDNTESDIDEEQDIHLEEDMENIADEMLEENQSHHPEESTDASEDNLIDTKRKRKAPGKYKDFVLMTYQEAVNGPEKESWLKAIKDEKDSLMKNNTWTLVNECEANDSKILTNKWIFKVKENGQYKARLVVRGFEQENNVDLNEIFSPVVGASSLRTIIAIAAVKNYHMFKFDVKTAFLYGELKDNVYMKIPEGYQGKGKICKLNKALYGLKQAPVIWNKTFINVMKENGLSAIQTEQCIFKNKDGTIIIAIYVDDGIAIGEDKGKLSSILEGLEKTFDMKREENPKNFLGMQIISTEENIKLIQQDYIDSILEKFYMTNAKAVDTPNVLNKEERSDKLRMDYPYREGIGSLLYLSTRTRPDIAQAVNLASRNIEKPVQEDIVAFKRILKYLIGNKTLGIEYSRNGNSLTLEAYCDADYAGDLETRRSTTGYVIFYGGGPISWCSKRQPIVALSTTEAEYISAADCCKEVIYHKYLIEELTGNEIKINLHIDNQSSINLIKTGVINKRSKHIDVRYFYIHEKVNEGVISVKYRSTDQQIADLLTKCLCKKKFEICKNRLVK